MKKSSGSASALKEITVRGVIIGIALTLLFTAANVYFGLKAGLTFSTSIPAVVISMALLRWLGNSTAQENNIVQTIASTAGTLSSIIFVLPGFIMIGWWTGFPYWESTAICVTGGILGVMYSIPLRRALVTESDLPYPEGTACAEVIKVGSGSSSKAKDSVESGGKGLKAVLMGSLVSALFLVVVQTRLFASDVVRFFRLGNGDDAPASGFDFALSTALFGIGHLVGITVGIAMFVGALIGWAWGVPHFSALHPAAGDATGFALGTWSHYVRFVGAGAIAVSAIWTLIKLVKPVIGGLKSAMASSKARKTGKGDTLARTELDIPVDQVGIVSLLCILPIAWLLWNFANGAGLGEHALLLTIGGIVVVVVVGFLVSTVCGYMAGLIGASNSPLSGIGILVVAITAMFLVLTVKSSLPPEMGKALVAYALFVTAVVFNVAAIANNNLQDLKTGQLVDATPAKQQWALVIGVVASALVIAPVLDLVNKAYGFLGAPGAGIHALPAPQAGLISALAQSVIEVDLEKWKLMGIGAGIGVACIVVDLVLSKTSKLRLPPLAVGLGIYLPTQSTLMVTVGAVVGWWFEKRADRLSKPKAEATKQLGTLLASGLIVGESILGVVFTALVVFTEKPFPIGVVGDDFAIPGLWIGGIAFAIMVYLLYRWTEKLAAK
ncbi:MAG TPA: oligopeptide transporter, OPT family [Gammaproteobacteria bacterium]|jgi:putative OPT family oligopeptide transporter|nr:oligopeptide transporter, OPT family [Gammaproteobacteria bacterium]